MKKLKKVLSLVLVLAMALSVFGVCASAADTTKNINDYSDVDEITYTKAVGVLSGLGVLQGSNDKDGVSSFKPLGNLNRAEAAKIATYLIGVQDKVVDSTTFTDVADSWAKSEIAIAQSQGLINGRNATTYDPKGTLTGYEWEKIVLCALGYDAEIEGLVGATWQGSTAVLAGKVGLLAGMNDDYDATKAITREQAALIAFNALNAQTVLYPTTINKIATFGDKTLGELVFNLGTDIAYNIYAAPVADTYVNAKTGDVYAEFSYEAIETYNDVAGGVKVTDIEDDIADAVGKKSVTATVYVDGVKATGLTTVGGRGVEVAAYAVNDGTYRIVVINTYATKIAKINPADTNSNGTVKTPATVAGLEYGAKLLAEGYEVGNIVVYNVGNQNNVTGKTGAPTYVVDTDTVRTDAGVKGYATTVSFDGTQKTAQAGTGYIVIDKAADKTYFDANANFAVARINKSTSTSTGYYNYVYDNYGHIIYVEEAKREKVSDAGHLYVINDISYYAENKTTDLGNLYYPLTNPQAAAQALVILYTDTTAEVQVVDLAITQTVDGKFAYLNEYGEAEADVQHQVGDITELGTPTEKFMEYYVTEDGKYILKTCADANDTVATGYDEKAYNITKGGDTVVADVNTKITYLTATIDPYTVAHLSQNNIVDVANSIKVEATTKTGYGNFAKATGNGYLEKSATTQKATVGAILSSTKVADTKLTAVFTGIKEKNSEGDLYTFVGSDGETYELYTTKADAQDGVTGTACQGATGEFLETDLYKVYTLELNSKAAGQKIVAKTVEPLVGYTVASDVTWTSTYGYLSGTAKYTNDIAPDKYTFDSSFKGYVYDQTIKAAKEVSSIVTATSNDYVAIYGTSAKITFVQTVAEPVTTTVYGSAVWAGSGFTDIKIEGNAQTGYNFVTSNGLTTSDFTDKAVDGNNVKIPADDWKYYDGQLFTLTFSKTVLKDNTVEYVLNGVKTASYIKTIDVYAIESNEKKTEWYITENATLSNGQGDYPVYTVKGDAVYVSKNDTLCYKLGGNVSYDSEGNVSYTNVTTANRQFDDNNIPVGNTLTLVYNAPDHVAIVYNDSARSE
jgi:hypothetical protein